MNLTSRYDGLVFDCDGTLADTMPAHYVAWCATMNRYGITFPEDRFYSLGGVPTRKIIHMLATEAGVVLDCDAVAKEKEEAFHQSLHAVGPIDVVVAIAEAHRGRLPMAVATGTVRWSAERVLRHIGIWDWFGAVVCADDVQNHKPEPDVYLLAAERLKVNPRRCCAYEDTDLGIASARAAGMDVIDIRTLLTSAAKR